MKALLLLMCMAEAEALFDTLPVQYAMTGWASGPDTVAGLLWSPAIFVCACDPMHPQIFICLAALPT